MISKHLCHLHPPDMEEDVSFQQFVFEFLGGKKNHQAPE